MPEPDRVDIHTHYLAQALVSALASRSELPRISGSNGKRLIHYGEGNVHPLLPAMVDLDQQLHEMEKAGIAHAVLSTNVPGVDWFPPAEGVAVARAINDELAEISKRRPARVSALAVLPMQAPQEAAAELERSVGLGLRGALVYSNVAGRDLDETEFELVFETAARLDVPIGIHPTYPLSAKILDAYALIPTLGFLVDTTTAALRLIFGGLYERHPGFKLYLCHAGSLIPQLAGRIDYEASRHPTGMGALTVPPTEHLRLLYTDTVCVWGPALRSALELVGPERLLFGSDYPFWDHARTVDTLAAVELAADARAAVEGKNATRLLGLALDRASA